MSQIPRTRVRLCGRFEVTIDGNEIADRVPAGQARTVLTYMLSTSGRACDRSELIEAIWGDHPPKDPQTFLRPVLSRLRAVLKPATIEGRELLELNLPSPALIDVEEAEEHLLRVREAALDDDWDAVREEADRARQLTVGGFLPGQEGEWTEPRRRQVADLELEALEWSARARLRLGGVGLREADPLARELIERSPFHEAGYQILMEALAADGNPAEALLVYENLRTLLRDELGTSPHSAIRELHGRLLREHSSGASDWSGAATASSPGPALPLALSPRERGAFVGRETELERLSEAWGRARNGHRELVLLSGDPGIGKTRLASEYALLDHSEGTVLYASCPQEALLPYQPIGEALRDFSLNNDLREIVKRLGPRAPYLAQLLPELTPEVAEGFPEDPETRRYMMFDAVSAFFAEASRESPIMLVLDDIHWADPPTLQLLRQVFASPHKASLFVLGTCRQGEFAGNEVLTELAGDLRRSRQFERVRLKGLDPGQVGQLITFYAGAEAPVELRSAIHEATDGNPFFVEEVLRNLVENGVLLDQSGQWAPRLTREDIGLPEAVEDVLTSRLGRLSPDCLAVLRSASALGREFPHDLLAQMTGLDSEQFIEALEEALAAQLVVEAARADGPHYEFTHALVRETLYRGLTGARRRQLHADAASAIEATGDGLTDEQVAALALHLRLADTAGDPEKAVEFSLRAGSRAFELLAWDEAALHWDGAVGVLERLDRDPALRADLLVTLADLMVITGDVGRQIDLLENALALSDELGDGERSAKVHSRLGMAHALMDSIYAEFLDIGLAFEHFEAARAALDREPATAGLGHLETSVATAHTYGIRIHEGIEASARAVDIGTRLSNDRVWMGAAEAHGWHLIVSGRLERGFGIVREAFEKASEQRRPFLAWMATNILGQLTWGLGDPDRAQKHFERARDLPFIERSAYRQQIADGIGRCYASRGEFEQAEVLLSDAKPAWFTHSLKPLVDLWRGNWDSVERLAREVVETSRGNGNRWDEWAADHLLARVHDLRGDPLSAVECLERSLEIVESGGAGYFEMWVRPDLARCLLEAGRTQEARLQIESCRSILAGGEQWRGRGGQVELAEAVVLAGENRPEEAELAFARALDTFRSLKLRCDEAEALLQWGRASSRFGAGQSALRHLDSAIEIFERHGAGDAMIERARRIRQEATTVA